MVDDSKPFLKKLADGDLGSDEFESLQLWLLPVLLRSRQRYYSDAIQAVQSQVENAWRGQGAFYPSREAFDESQFIQDAWRRASPYWWGLNDIVGFIDIRANVVSLSLDATLFLTTKRATRSLVDKVFVQRAQQSVAIVPAQSDHDLRAALNTAVTHLAEDERLRRRYLDLDSWRRVLNRTNVLQIVLDEIESLASTRASHGPHGVIQAGGRED